MSTISARASSAPIPRRRRQATLPALVLVALGASACSTPRIDLAAWRAQEVGARSAEARGAHARRTMEVADGALADDPHNATAAATLAIVHLRLETLPWIAKLMARGRPDSSLEEAERYARIAVDAAPSREQRLVLAKVLRAADRDAEARAALEAALAAPPQFPRDDAVEADVRALLGQL